MSKIAPAINLDKAKGKHYVKDWWLGRPWVTEAGGGCPWAPSWPDVCGEIKMALLEVVKCQSSISPVTPTVHKQSQPLPQSNRLYSILWLHGVPSL